MSRISNAIAVVSRLALLSLMLAVQGMAFAHQVDHLAPVDGNECAACVAGHAFGAAVPVTHALPAPVRTLRPSATAQAVDHTPPTVAPFGARAPPLCS